MALSLQVSRAVSARKMRSNFTSRLAILSKYVCVCVKNGAQPTIMLVVMGYDEI